MRKFYAVFFSCIFCVTLFTSLDSYGQNPAFQVTSTTGGFVPPQLTQAQRLAITATSTKGTLVYQTDLTQGYYFYDGAVWKLVNDIGSLTGVVPIANGGTNTTTVGAAGSVTYSNGTQYASTAVGTAGQVLLSNGAAAPVWSSLVQNSVTSLGSAAFTVSLGSPGPYLINGLTQTITVPTSTVILVTSDGGISCTSTAATGFVAADIAIYVDGSTLGNLGIRRVIAANTTGLGSMINNWSISQAITLAPGTHTIAMGAGFVQSSASAVGAIISGSATGANRGQMTITVLKQVP